MNLSTIIRQHPVASFIVLALGLSLATFLVPVPPESAFAVIAFLLVMIPTIVAFGLVGLVDGRPGLRVFLREVFVWRVALKWVLIALVLGFVLHIGSSILALVAGRISTIEIAAPTAFFIAYFPLGLLEEIGWRGFALRRLLDRYSPFLATLMVGIPWALLHFTLFLFFLPDVSAVAEGLVVLTFALPLTWVYIRSGRSVLVATVLHGALNAFGIAGVAIPPTELLWFVLASACIVAAVLVLIDRAMWFASPPKPDIGETMRVATPLGS